MKKSDVMSVGVDQNCLDQERFWRDFDVYEQISSWSDTFMLLNLYVIPFHKFFCFLYYIIFRNMLLFQIFRVILSHIPSVNFLQIGWFTISKTYYLLLPISIRGTGNTVVSQRAMVSDIVFFPISIVIEISKCRRYFYTNFTFSNRFK